MPYKDKYIRFDSGSDAYSSLELFTQQLAHTVENQLAWKWAIITLHNSLQAFMVLTLQNKNSLNVFNKHKKQRELDSIIWLYEKIKIPAYMHKAYVPGGTQDQSIKYLHEIRNELMHFKPQLYALTFDFLVVIFEDCISIIQFLILESKSILWFPEETLEKLERLINQSQTTLFQVKNMLCKKDLLLLQ